MNLEKLAKKLKSLGCEKESSEVLFLIKEANSVGSIVRLLGYPSFIAKALQNRFGRLSFHIAKWLKETNTNDIDIKYGNPDAWISRLGKSQAYGPGSVQMADLGYKAVLEGEEAFRKYLDDNELSSYTVDEKGFDSIKEEYLKYFESEVIRAIEEDILFYPTFGKHILEGKIKTLTPYKNMPWEDAVRKYDRKLAFEDKSPLKTYPNGMKWIDLGLKSTIIKDHLGNCGSAGLMSMDKDRTMVGLFDKNNQAVAVVTWSPNEKRISGEEGSGHGELASEYHHYVIDLAKHLGVEFDVDRAKSQELGMKYRFKDVAEDFKVIHQNLTEKLYSFKIQGMVYISNGHDMIPEAEANRRVAELENLSEEERQRLFIPSDRWGKMRRIFNYRYKNQFGSDGYESIRAFLKRLNEKAQME